MGVHVTDDEFRKGYALLGGFHVPSEGEGGILPDTVPGEILVGQRQLRIRVAQLGRADEVFERSDLVGSHELAFGIDLGQLPMRPGASEVGGALVPVDRFRDVHVELLAGLHEVSQSKAGIRIAGDGVVLEGSLHLDFSVLIFSSSAAASGSP